MNEAITSRQCLLDLTLSSFLISRRRYSLSSSSFWGRGGVGQMGLDAILDRQLVQQAQ